MPHPSWMCFVAVLDYISDVMLFDVMLFSLM